jgi:hypothetical protein
MQKPAVDKKAILFAIYPDERFLRLAYVIIGQASLPIRAWDYYFSFLWQ